MALSEILFQYIRKYIFDSAFSLFLARTTKEAI